MQDTSIINANMAANQRKRHTLDAKGKILGRLATQAAGLLRGKHKAIYTPNVDCGDFVIVTNAAEVALSGNKLETKAYFSHSGYARGAKMTPLKRMMEKDPRKVVYLAVKRMLPKNRLSDRQLTRLRIFKGAVNAASKTSVN
jgi:large subunit ribosomal protein L13